MMIALCIWLWLLGALACLSGIHREAACKPVGMAVVILTWPALVMIGTAKAMFELFYEERHAK